MMQPFITSAADIMSFKHSDAKSFLNVNVTNCVTEQDENPQNFTDPEISKNSQKTKSFWTFEYFNFGRIKIQQIHI